MKEAQNSDYVGAGEDGGAYTCEVCTGG